jgi:hypothetical protein
MPQRQKHHRTCSTQVTASTHLHPYPYVAISTKYKSINRNDKPETFSNHPVNHVASKTHNAQPHYNRALLRKQSHKKEKKKEKGSQGCHGPQWSGSVPWVCQNPEQQPLQSVRLQQCWNHRTKSVGDICNQWMDSY